MEKTISVLILENEDSKVTNIIKNISQSKITTNYNIFWTKDGDILYDKNKNKLDKRLEDKDLEEGNVDIILVDLKIDILDKKYKNYGGISFLERIFRQPNPCLSVIVESANLESIKKDCPIGGEVLEDLKTKQKIIAIDRNKLRDTENPLLRQIISSRVGRRILPKHLEQQIVFLGRTNDTVLILGEAGTGKEGVARALHKSWCENMHEGKNRPFVSINAGALQNERLRSELFGYNEDAYTGASKNGSIGLALKACGVKVWNEVKNIERLDDSKNFQGTLFLDEIGNLDYTCQGLLLRFLEEPYAIAPLAHADILNVRPRIIAATNNENWMRFAVKGFQGRDEKDFRMDLFDRLAHHILWIPKLKPEDVVGLIKTVCNEEWDVEAIKYTADCINRKIIRGNIRGLINFIKRAELIINKGQDLGWPIFNIVTVDVLKLALLQASPPEMYSDLFIDENIDKTEGYKSLNGNLITEDQLEKAIEYAKQHEIIGVPSPTKDKPGELMSKYGHIETELILLIWFYIYSNKRKPNDVKLEEYKCMGGVKWFRTTSKINAHKSIQQIAKRHLGFKNLQDLQQQADQFVKWCKEHNKWPSEMIDL